MLSGCRTWAARKHSFVSGAMLIKLHFGLAQVKPIRTRSLVKAGAPQRETKRAKALWLELLDESAKRRNDTRQHAPTLEPPFAKLSCLHEFLSPVSSQERVLELSCRAAEVLLAYARSNACLGGPQRDMFLQAGGSILSPSPATAHQVLRWWDWTVVLLRHPQRPEGSDSSSENCDQQPITEPF